MPPAGMAAAGTAGMTAGASASPLPRVEADEVRAEFDQVAVLQRRGCLQRLTVEPGAQPAAVVFQDVASVELAGDAGVLGLQVPPRVAEKRQRRNGPRADIVTFWPRISSLPGRKP